MNADRLPLLTVDLPDAIAIGGVIDRLEDFVVHELPAYEPCGEGEHVYVSLEKRKLTTPQALARIAKLAGVSVRDCGYAGLKDKHAVACQWVSLPPGAAEQPLVGYHDDSLRVLVVTRHRNKLRTGHLRGNRFVIRLRRLDVPLEAAYSQARACLACLQRGMPNYFGSQRFGVHGDNAHFARQVISGAARAPRDKRRRRLIASALQSELFNALLAMRVEQRQLFRVVDGDVLQKSDSGGLFVSEDTATDQARLDRGELVTTGPLWGPRATLPRENSPARQLELDMLQNAELSIGAFERFGRDARGGRRALFVRPTELSASLEDDALRLAFALPAGSYATVLIREITRAHDDPRGQSLATGADDPDSGI